MSVVVGLRQLVLVALCVGAFAGCAHVEPGREVLEEMEFEGNATLSDAEIEERLALSETPIWPWADPRYYDAGTLTGDRRRLLRYYQANGFYEARVKSRVRRGDGEARVTFVVEEGPASLVERVEVQGLEDLPQPVRQAVLARPLPLRKGARITEAAWDATRRELAQRLRDQGYGDVEVAGSVQVDVDARKAAAVAQVEPGQRLAFGRTVITGGVEIPRKTILESVRRDIPEGSRYSDARLAEAEANLLSMGVFGAVRVSRGPTNPENGTVPVMVAVREAPFQTVRAGVGAGIDGSGVTMRATGDYAHRNFLGGLRTLRFENEIGYALLTGEAAEIVEQGVVGESALDFTQPDLIRRLDANLRLEYEHDLEFAYTFDAVKGRVGFPIRLHRSLTFTPSYNVQRFWLEQNEGVESSGESGNCQLEQGDCVLAYVEERLAWDRRDNPIETTSGWYTALSVQQGRSWLGSESNYDRVLGEVRWYQPMPWDWVLALKVEGGLLFPHELEPGVRESSPIMERFYAGGQNSVRAFANQRLSPVARSTSAAQDTVPIGGDALLEGSAELRVPLVGDLGMALFVDAGNVARDAFTDAGELLRPNVGVGAGIRYKTPFGPVRLDVGWLAVKNLPCLVEDGACSDVAVEEDPFAIHFSIGEAF
ncbi:autotransporter assembly complex protein TamA [Vulgatibacter sp.]|uniref:autotransporter assembly complex protein TamA n=1 Tax=Vulgatibacter sp. TaxID=1971226 RepID=UPI003565832A